MFVKTVGSFLEKNNNHPNNMKIFMMNIEKIVPIFCLNLILIIYLLELICKVLIKIHEIFPIK